jgi:hypothetical protein
LVLPLLIEVSHASYAIQQCEADSGSDLQHPELGVP